MGSLDGERRAGAREGSEPMRSVRLTLVLGMVLMLAAPPRGQSPTGSDWPQWRGPERNGISKEQGLLKQWPPSGPPQVWTTAGLGGGYGSIAIVGDRIFAQGMTGRDSIV